MQRTAINPWPWSLQYAYNQAELIQSHTRMLFCAGQTSIDNDGNPQHADDIAAQLTLAIENLESVLTEAGMSLSDVVRLTTYTTDVDALMPHYGLLAERLGANSVAPAATLLGVARLTFPDLLVEIEATAAQ